MLLGSNQGDKQRYMMAGRELLEKHGRILGASSIQESKAWGKTDQEDFLNQVILFESALSPQDLLETIHDIEAALERNRQEKWGPRTLDIDILYAGNQIVNEPNLQIPHPLIQERLFTLILLQEISPEFVHPVLQMSNNDLLNQLRQSS